MEYHHLIANGFKTACILVIAVTIMLLHPGTGKAADSCPSEPTDMIVGYGSTVTCAVDSDGDSDLFRFVGEAGDAIVAQVAWQSGSVRPCLELIAPDNSRTEVCVNAFTNRIDTTLTQSGTHTLRIDAFFGGTGNYAIALERLTTPSPNAPEIEYGDLYEEEIGPVGDLDLLFFEGKAGEAILLQVAWQDGSMRPCIELIAPDNSRIDACANAFTNRIDVTLDQTGVYSVLVDVLFGGSGGYAVAIERLLSPSASAKPLIPGEFVTSEINPIGDLDLYTFDATADDVIILTMAWNSGTMRPCLQLIHPDNTRSAACENSFSNQLDLTLSQTGTYAVLADVVFGGKGEYTIDLQCVVGKCRETTTLPIFLPIITRS